MGKGRPRTFQTQAHNFSKMIQKKFHQVKSTLSKKDKKIYYASLCAVPPPRACRLSRKKMKHKQRMALRRTRGDSMLNAMNFESDYDESSLSVNELLRFCSLRLFNLTQMTVAMLEAPKNSFVIGFTHSFSKLRLLRAKMIIQLGGRP